MFVSNRDHDFEHIDKSIDPVIEVCGFMDIADISSPQCVSRHLVLPIPSQGTIVIYHIHVVLVKKGMLANF